MPPLSHIGSNKTSSKHSGPSDYCAFRVPEKFLVEGGALPAAPELPFSPRTEELFSSLSGWNVSVLAP